MPGLRRKSTGSGGAPLSRGSIVEAIAQLHKNLARVHVMSAAEGEAVVEQNTQIHDIQAGHGERESFGEVFANGHVESGVPGQVTVRVWRRISVGESRAIVDIA